MLDKVENFMNMLTDIDSGWWPVLFLRPAKNKNIDNTILVKLSLVFGPILGLGLWFSSFANTGIINFGNALLFVLTACLLFFVLYKVTFAYFWNRRARRLRSQ